MHSDRDLGDCLERVWHGTEGLSVQLRYLDVAKRKNQIMDYSAPAS